MSSFSALTTVQRTDRGRVAVLALDYPGRTMNVVDELVLDELAEIVDAVMADDAVDAMVLTSAKPGYFGAGADVAWLPELAARPDAEAFLAGVHDLMVRLVRSPKPLVAALNGPAFGGAFELALAAREIVVTPNATLGLPEVTLHLLPGGGGTQLLTRFVPPAVAAELLTSGRRVPAAEAAELGLVSSIVDPDDLEEVAVQRAGSLSAAPPQKEQGADRDRAAMAVDARREELRSSRRGMTAAAATILDVLARGLAEGLERGLEAERSAFLAQLAAPEARAALHVFQAESDVKRRSRAHGAAVEKLGVVGAGQMGAGIASTAVTRGLATLVRDVNDEQLRRARDYLDRALRRVAPADTVVASSTALWTTTTRWSGFEEVDAVVEAVFESLEVKNEVLGHVSELLHDDVLLASNTSAIPIGRLAEAVRRPERFLGMHFFSPVERMPLVELIPHASTDSSVVARAAALGRRLGKVPVVVGDAPGFFTSRVYARWLIEGIRLLLDGVPPADIEDAAKAVGFPVGPLQAHDEATLDLVVDASITQVAEPVMTQRLDVAAVRRALESLIAAGVRGRRHGHGFYTYDEDGRRSDPNREVVDVLGVTPAPLPGEEVADRLLLAFASECFLCWDDGTLCHPDDGDVAAVLGIGFPRMLGGPFHWADESGAADILRRCEALGPEFPPSEALAERVSDGGRLGDQPRRARPLQVAGEVES